MINRNYRLAWVLLVVILIIIQFLSLSPIFFQILSLLPLLFISYIFIMEGQVVFYQKNRLFNFLAAIISFFLFFLQIDNYLFRFFQEPWRRIILVIMVVIYAMVVKIIVARASQNRE